MNEGELKGQSFHAAHEAEYGCYEELEGRIAERQYTRDLLEHYFRHCVDKITMKMGAEADDGLLIPKADYYGTMSKAERYIKCTRPTQHHAAQLGLRLQFITGKEIGWIGRSKADHGQAWSLAVPDP